MSKDIMSYIHLHTQLAFPSYKQHKEKFQHTFKLILQNLLLNLNEKLNHSSTNYSFEEKYESFIYSKTECSVCKMYFHINIYPHFKDILIIINGKKYSYTFQIFENDNNYIEDFIKNKKFNFQNCNEYIIENIME